MKKAHRLRGAGRTAQIIITFFLVFALSFTAVFADAGTQAEDVQTQATQTEGIQSETVQAEGTQSETAQTETGTDETADGDLGEGEAQPEEPQIDEPDPEPDPEVEPETKPVTKPTAKVIKKGKYYYYKNANGTIRKKAGFVTVDGNLFYVRKGGRIRTNKIFKVKKKYYCANKQGVIKKGVYKWKKSYYYSNSKGVLKRSAGFITWNGNKYYVRKGGKIIVGDGFSVKNLPYAADKKGCVTSLEIPEGDGSDVIAVAKKQVGTMTGKTYWRWYFKTKFIDTDRTPWCGAFVAWCYNKAGHYKKISVAKKFGNLGYVPSYSRYANKYKKWISVKQAKGGDIIVFGRNRHVGLVEGIVGDYIITIEGNAGPTAAIGCKKPGAVVRNVYKIKSKSIKGVIHVMD